MAKVTINGEKREIQDTAILSDLLNKLDLNAAYFAVAVNDKVIPRSEHLSVKINDGDKIEVIHAVGGG